MFAAVGTQMPIALHVPPVGHVFATPADVGPRGAASTAGGVSPLHAASTSTNARQRMLSSYTLVYGPRQEGPRGTHRRLQGLGRDDPRGHRRAQGAARGRQGEHGRSQARRRRAAVPRQQDGSDSGLERGQRRDRRRDGAPRVLAALAGLQPRQPVDDGGGQPRADVERGRQDRRVPRRRHLRQAEVVLLQARQTGRARPHAAAAHRGRRPAQVAVRRARGRAEEDRADRRQRSGRCRAAPQVVPDTEAQVMRALIPAILLVATLGKARADDFETAQRVRRIENVVWALTATCDQGDDTQHRQCKHVRDTRAHELAGATLLVDGDADAFDIAPFDAKKKSIALTLTSCIRCAGVDLEGKSWVVTGGSKKLYDNARAFSDEATAKAWLKPVGRPKVQLHVKVPPKAVEGTPVMLDIVGNT